MKQIFFDLETTGFLNDDEILSIAMVGMNGNVLLDTFVCPTHKREWLDEPLRNDVRTDCCLTLAKQAYPGISHKLSDMMDYLDLTWTGDAHTALPDTVACKDIWNAIQERSRS